MKKVLLIFAVTLYFSASHAQSLEFSRILLIDTLTAAQDKTVPTGKVWKIESVLGARHTSRIFTTTSSINTQLITINGYHVNMFTWDFFFNGSTASNSSYARTSSSAAAQITQLPIWLPEGTTVALGPPEQITGIPNTAAISIIEFSVLP